MRARDEDGVRTCGVLREDQPVWVRCCARCRAAFRTNAREQAYCDECQDEMCAMEAEEAEAMGVDWDLEGR
jgi:uncharacterized Zn ribbon protein